MRPGTKLAGDRHEPIQAPSLSETNAPLARAVIDGLLVSTTLTLFLVPTLYTMLEERFPRKEEHLPETLPAQV